MMPMMRRLRAIAALMAVLLPLGTPAAAWAGEQCCASGPLAAFAATVATSEAPCHKTALLAPALAAGYAVSADDAVGADDCRMDHLGLRAAPHMPDATTVAPALLPSLAGTGPLTLLVRAAAVDRGPPAHSDLTLLHGILRI